MPRQPSQRSGLLHCTCDERWCCLLLTHLQCSWSTQLEFRVLFAYIVVLLTPTPHAVIDGIRRHPLGATLSQDNAVVVPPPDGWLFPTPGRAEISKANARLQAVIADRDLLLAQLEVYRRLDAANPAQPSTRTEELEEPPHDVMPAAKATLARTTSQQLDKSERDHATEETLVSLQEEVCIVSLMMGVH